MPFDPVPRYAMRLMDAAETSTPLKYRVKGLLDRAYEARSQDGADSARELVTLIDSLPERARELQGYRACARFLVLDGEGRLEEAFDAGESALPLLERCGASSWHCRMLSELGSNLGRRGRCEEALPLLERGLAASRESGYRDLEGRILFLLGNIYDMLGDARRALDVTLEACKIYRQLGNRAGEGTALSSIGPLYRILGAYPEALDALKRAIVLLEVGGAQSALVSALLNLAVVYVVVGLHDEALQAAERALEIVPAESPAAVDALSACVYAYGESGRHEVALVMGERALRAARTQESDHLIADVLLRVGDVLLAAGRLDEAEDRYREALALARDMDDLRISVGCKVGLARVLEEQGEADRAHALVEPLLEAWEQYGEHHTLIELHELLSRLCESLDDPAQSLAHLKRVHALRADLFSRETGVRLHNIHVSDELRRERERSAEEVRELSGRVIQSQEDERRRVASDLHDDLGQRLALLAVEIDILAQSPPDSREDAATALGLLAEHAQSIAEQVHVISHQLHPATLAQLGFVKATQAMCGQTAGLLGIEVEVHAHVEGQVPDDVGLCLYRILQEGLQNVTRHGQASQVTVRIGGDGGEVYLTISDNGSGFDPQAVSGSGIGLASMYERARHLGGHLTVRSAPGRGATIDVRLPCPETAEGTVE
jgi:signal transduction histidine kinase